MQVSAGSTLIFLCLILLQFTRVKAQQHFSLPLRSLALTSTFGQRIHPVLGKPDFHRGIDLHARTEPVMSILLGRVVSTGFHSVLGNFVRISHGEIESVYGHLSIIAVCPGETVEAGSFIGVTGSTGRATGEHLHFAVTYLGNHVNPLKFLLGLFGNETACQIVPPIYKYNLK